MSESKKSAIVSYLPYILPVIFAASMIVLGVISDSLAKYYFYFFIAAGCLLLSWVQVYFLSKGYVFFIVRYFIIFGVLAYRMIDDFMLLNKLTSNGINVANSTAIYVVGAVTAAIGLICFVVELILKLKENKQSEALESEVLAEA